MHYEANLKGDTSAVTKDNSFGFSGNTVFHVLSSLFPHSKVLLKKLVISQLVKEFRAFYAS
jgi:hypothetical protein